MPMSPTVTDHISQLVPRGVYRVGDRVFENKVEALLESDKTNIHPTWDFHDGYFSRFDWETEPSESIDYYYRTRCQQIRDKYDHVVLHYSGGSDSHNILAHFHKSNIFVDEILVAAPIKFYDRYTIPTLSTEPGDLHNEWYNVIKPDLEWIYKNLPKTKVTVYDYTDDMLGFTVDQDWILHAGEHCNPNIINRINRYTAIDQNLYDRRTVGHVYGVDKPQVFMTDGHWYFAFLDSILSIQSSYKPVFDRHTHVNIENFYWSPDLPQLLIKQAHLVKNFFEANHDLVRLATFKNRTMKDRSLYQDIVREVIYPYWRKEIFQNKKASNSFFKEFDAWFFTHASEAAQKKWWEGFDFLTTNVRDSWFNHDAQGKKSGIVGMWSKWYRLSKIESEQIAAF